jgi:hypothetical protein
MKLDPILLQKGSLEQRSHVENFYRPMEAWMTGQVLPDKNRVSIHEIGSDSLIEREP